MNAEEIKLKIIKQFNTPGSALQSLMRVQKYDIRPSYYHKRKFILSEIGLHLLVETISEEGELQLIFRPIEEKDMKSPLSFVDLSRVSTFLPEIPHSFEEFKCSANGFQIITRTCSIAEKNYDFEFVSTIHTTLSVDNLCNIKISPFRTNGELMRYFNFKKTNGIYHTYKLTQEDIDKVLSINWSDRVPASLALRIQKAFSDAFKSSNKDKTQLYAVLEELLK